MKERKDTKDSLSNVVVYNFGDGTYSWVENPQVDLMPYILHPRFKTMRVKERTAEDQAVFLAEVAHAERVWAEKYTQEQREEQIRRLSIAEGIQVAPQHAGVASQGQRASSSSSPAAQSASSSSSSPAAQSASSSSSSPAAQSASSSSSSPAGQSASSSSASPAAPTVLSAAGEQGTAFKAARHCIMRMHSSFGHIFLNMLWFSFRRYSQPCQ
jgi:hypothetical protein